MKYHPVPLKWLNFKSFLSNVDEDMEQLVQIGTDWYRCSVKLFDSSSYTFEYISNL